MLMETNKTSGNHQLTKGILWECYIMIVIYGREVPYMRIFSSVNVHIQKTKCAYTETLFRICKFMEGSNYMPIFPSLYVYLQKEKCAYMKESFHKCAFIPFVNVHI